MDPVKVTLTPGQAAELHLFLDLVLPIAGESLDEKRFGRLDETKRHIAKALTRAGARLDGDGWRMPAEERRQ